MGGPYAVTATLCGFRRQEQVNVIVPLGETLEPGIQAAAGDRHRNRHGGSRRPIPSSIRRERARAATSRPSSCRTSRPCHAASKISRARRLFLAIADNAEPGAISVAGRNKYNSIQIDGAVNNDLFGLSATGAPGGQTESQPISIDAIEELQLLVAPYDVRQGGFSGGGVNAVTKSGTNAVQRHRVLPGTVRNLVGHTPIPSREPIAALRRVQREDLRRKHRRSVRQEQGVFFFGNFEVNRRGVPSGFSVGGS